MTLELKGIRKAFGATPVRRYPHYPVPRVRRLPRPIGVGQVVPNSKGMDGPLTHHQYDTFRTNPSLKWIEPAYVTFSLDADGKVNRVTMKPVPPAADFSYDYHDLLFTPVAVAK